MNPHQEQTKDKMETLSPHEMLLKYHVGVDVLSTVHARDGHLGSELDRIKMAMIEYGADKHQERQKEHSYSEQEIISMLEALRRRCAEEARDTPYDLYEAVETIDVHKFILPLTK